MASRPTALNAQKTVSATGAGATASPARRVRARARSSWVLAENAAAASLRSSTITNALEKMGSGGARAQSATF